MLLSALSALASPPRDVAVVVVDLEAREQGYALELEGVLLEEVLPIDVVEGEQVLVVDPDGGRHPLDVAGGEAWVVSGPQGEAWMARLGEDVRTDVVAVRGDLGAVRALAARLHAEIRIRGDAIRLHGPDLLYRLPWAEAEGLDRLDEVAYVAAASAEREGVRGPEVGAPRPPGPQGSGVVKVALLEPQGSVLAQGTDRQGRPVAGVASSWTCNGRALGLRGTGPGMVAVPPVGEWWVTVDGAATRLLVREGTQAQAVAELLRTGCP